MTEVMSGVVTPQDKKKSPPCPPLANQKCRSITKSVVSFYSFPVALGGDLLQKSYQH